jgi:hypothetical protein
MSPLTITEAALAIIQECLSKSPSVPDPAVALVEVSSPLAMNPEWARAFKAGADEQSLRELLMKHHGEDLPKLRTRLVPEVRSRHDFLEKTFVEVGGITFHLSPDTQVGWILDAGQDGLILKDANGVVVRPKPLSIP